MKTVLWISVGITAVVLLVVFGLAAGWALWGQRLWAAEPLVYAPLRNGGGSDDTCSSWQYDGGRGMMAPRSAGPQTCKGWGSNESAGKAPAATAELTMEIAQHMVEAYLASQGYANLEIAEVMEFERNFYAIAREPDTGIGAMELLVDKQTGTVGPEMGPNMMWNTEYGMHRRGRMMNRSGGSNAIPPKEAVEIAQRWLDGNRPGLSADEHPDPFYGYYTIHTLEDGRIVGMLSVQGTTGQVWYHTWHGAFIQMIEHEDGH